MYCVFRLSLGSGVHKFVISTPGVQLELKMGSNLTNISICQLRNWTQLAITTLVGLGMGLAEIFPPLFLFRIRIRNENENDGQT
jgi:hypothetical protein